MIIYLGMLHEIDEKLGIAKLFQNGDTKKIQKVTKGGKMRINRCPTWTVWYYLLPLHHNSGGHQFHGRPTCRSLLEPETMETVKNCQRTQNFQNFLSYDFWRSNQLLYLKVL